MYCNFRKISSQFFRSNIQMILSIYYHFYIALKVHFTNGMLLNNNNNCYNNGFRQIRGDFIHWVTGNEFNCKNIRVLMKTLDTIVFRCNTMSNNGLMGVNSISSRTPAMIALEISYDFDIRL